MSTTERSQEVDIIRMAALFGICIVNVPFMALSAEAVLTPPGNSPDRIAAFFVESFFQLKFFILFSFIFGWGMAIQAKAPASPDHSFAKRYFRRMAGLAMLGAAHALLVFSGDILILYALLGTLLWLIKDFPPKKLMLVCAWMLPLSMLCLTALGALFELAQANGAFAAAPGTAQLGGNFLEATVTRLGEWPGTMLVLLLLQGPMAFGAFAAGLAAAKADFFSHGSPGFERLRPRWPALLLIALPLNFLYAAVVGGMVAEHNKLLAWAGFVLVAIGAPALSLLYLLLLIQAARLVKIPRILVLAGRNSLSSYVAQGILAGFVFGSYGLGLFGKVGHAALIVIALLIALLAMLSVGLYATAMGRGPLEPILRKLSGN